ncbi:MAG: YIP1 family protein [Terriglobales bacterium]
MATNPSVPSQPTQLSQVPAQSPQESPHLSEVQRVINVFFAPTKTFTDLRRSASWWLPFLIVAIIGVMFNYVVDQKVGFRKVVENQIRIQPKQAARMDSLPADQHENVMRQQASFWKWFSYVAPLVGLLYYLIIAVVLFGTFKFAASADIRFKTMYALVVFAWLPAIFVYLLAILSLLVGVSSDGFLIQNPAATNVGIMIDPNSSPVLYALLSSVDILTFWSLALMAIGVTCISKVKRSTAFAIVFGWFGFWVLVKIGLAAATS